MDLSVFELSLQHAGALKAVYRLPVCGTAVVIAGENQLRLAGTGDAVLSRTVHIAVSVAGDCDRLLPGTHNRRNPFDHDRRAENRAVQNGADCAVGAFPHLGKVVFLHALGVGVMVAHLTATPYFLFALAASTVT